MGKKCKYGWFLKGINDDDTDYQIAIFLQILAHCVMVFFQIIPCTMCIFLYKTPYNLGFVSEAKKYENNEVRTMSYT